MDDYLKDFLKEVGSKVKLRRDEMRWDQAELARRAGTSPTTLSSIELGKTSTNLAMIVSLAGALKCEPWELLKPDGAEETSNKSIALVPKADEMRDLLGILSTLKEPQFRRVLKLARGLSGLNGDDLDEVSHDIQEG